MPEKVLFVDDEPAILSAFTRMLRPEMLRSSHPSVAEFAIDTAPGGQTGLAAIRDRGPYAVIVSDLRMPGMDGVRFLEEARRAAPDAARIMLTGQADVANAIDAVNRGALFRFLTKPCEPEALVAAIDAGLRQHQLVTAERQLLDQTLAGSVKVLTEVLALVNPSASSRALRVRRIVSHLVARLDLEDAWQLEIAALLSQLGYLTLGIDEAETDGTVVSLDARRRVLMHPAAARDLLANIPRLEQVAAIVGGQQDAYDAADSSTSVKERDRVKFGAQVLRTALAFDAGMCAGLSAPEATSRLRLRGGQVDPVLVDALADFEPPTAAYIPRRVTVNDLRSGMLLDQDVRNDSGLLLIARGHEVTLPVLIRLKTLVAAGAIGTQMRVLARAE